MVGNLNTTVIYRIILALENEGTAVNCLGILITLAPVANIIKLFGRNLRH